MKAVMMAS